MYDFTSYAVPSFEKYTISNQNVHMCTFFEFDKFWNFILNFTATQDPY